MGYIQNNKLKVIKYVHKPFKIFILSILILKSIKAYIIFKQNDINPLDIRLNSLTKYEISNFSKLIYCFILLVQLNYGIHKVEEKFRGRWKTLYSKKS